MNPMLVIFFGLLASALNAGNAFFVTFQVQAPAGALGQDAQAAMSAGVTLLRDQIPGEPAYQMAGPDGPGVGRIYTRPGVGSYVLTDAGSQWVSAVGQGQPVLGVVETYAPQFQWAGNAFVGAVRGSISKADIVAGRLSLAPVLMSEIPAPLASVASEQSIGLSLPAFVDASGLASGLVLWRQQGSSGWQKLADLPLSSSWQAFTDSGVTAQAAYHYGLSVRFPWAGGGQAGALPLESGSYVSLARSDSGLIWASNIQPSPTPFPTLPVAQPTPDLGSEAWLAYPNPNRDGKVHIAFHMVEKGTFEVRAFSLDGVLIYHLEGGAEAGAWAMPVADLSQMASGIYLVRLTVKYEGEATQALPLRKLALVR